MSFNTAKIINVYYKADRKPYDANGKPISYFGEDFIGGNESTEIRFYMPEGVDLGAVDCVVEVKRANGDKRFDLLTKITNGDGTYYRLVTNNWYNQYVGKTTIAFKAYFGGVTIVDGVITATTGAIYVSDIFHLQIAYAPTSTEEVPPFDPSDVSTFVNALSAKLNVNNGIFVITTALPENLSGYDGQWFLVKNNIDGEQGRLYYIESGVAKAVELELGTLKMTATGNGELTEDTGKITWNQPDGTATLGLYNNVNIGLGEDIFYYGKASANITKGQAVQFVGYQGDHILMKPAVPSEINANPRLIMGIAKQSISSGDFGYVLAFGKLNGVDTGSFVAGNFLWFASEGSTPGQLTNTQPLAPSAKVLMAAVIKAETSGAANNGVIQVRITFEPKLGELQDVEITNIQNNDVLKFNTATQKWENTNAFVLVDEELNLIETRLDVAESDIDNIESAISNVDNTADLDKPISTATQSALDLKADLSYVDGELATKADTSALATKADLVDGKVPSTQLPSFVDDVVEYANLASFPETGEAGKIYVALDTDKTYRWSGSTYTVISETLAIGETSSTAFAGNRGVALEGVVNTANQVDTGVLVWNATSGKFESANNFVKTSAGNVGIGTTSPGAKLTVSGFANDGVKLLNAEFLHTVAPNYGIRIAQTWNAVTGVDKRIEFLDNNTIEATIGTIAGAGAGVLTFNTNGSERLRINASGNVGIGTTSPATKLEVAGGDITVSGVQNKSVRVQSSTSNYAYLANFGDYAQLGVNRDPSSGVLADANKASAEIAMLGENNNSKIIFATTNTNGGVPSSKMIITGDGNVGIGTTSPTELLQVNGRIKIGDDSTNPTSADAMIYQSSGIGLTLSTYQFAIRAGSTPTERLRILDNGNVGIGTTSASERLDVNGWVRTANGTFNGGGLLIPSNANSASREWAISTEKTALGDFAILQSSAQNTSGKDGTIRFYIDPSGNVGIGTTSPAQKLDVQGNIAMTGTLVSPSYTNTGTIGSNAVNSRNHFSPYNAGDASITGGWIAAAFGDASTNRVVIGQAGNVGSGALLGSHNGNLDAWADLTVVNLATRFFTVNSSAYNERMTIANDGNVGIGTTSPSAKLDVNGVIKTISGVNEGGGVYYTYSGNSTDSRSWVIRNDVVAYGDFAIQQSSTQTGNPFAGTTRLYVSSAGNVGIGTTSPSAALHAQHNNADTTPAIIANLNNSSATGNIQVWQKAGSAVANIDSLGRFFTTFIGNYSDANNSRIFLNITGTEISRDVADSNPALIVNQNNSSSTGNIIVLQKAGSAVASFSNSGIFVGSSRPANDSKTANHTLTFVDEGRVLRINSSSDLTVTIPLNSGTELPIGFEVALIRYGTGAVTISPTSGVTLNSKNSERKISGQYASVALKKIGSDEWVLVGSLEA